MLRKFYVDTSGPVAGAIRVPSEAELQPLLAQLARVDALKQKGNECAPPPQYNPSFLKLRAARTAGPLMRIFDISS